MTSRGEKRERSGLDVLLQLNARVHEAARRFEGLEPGRDAWEFACECGAHGCREPVALTLADYEALREGGLPVLAPGHETATPDEAASAAG